MALACYHRFLCACCWYNIPGGHLYFNLYIIRIHENEEIGSFFGTRTRCVWRLGYQKWRNWEKKGQFCAWNPQKGWLKKMMLEIVWFQSKTSPKILCLGSEIMPISLYRVSFYTKENSSLRVLFGTPWTRMIYKLIFNIMVSLSYLL